MLMVSQPESLKLKIILVIFLSSCLLLISFASIAEEIDNHFSSQLLIAEDESEKKSSDQEQSNKLENNEAETGLTRLPEIKKLEQILEENRISSKRIDRKEEIYQSAVGFAQWVDNFFGEAEELESAGYDYLRLVNTIGWREGEGVQYRPRIKAKVNLPRMDKRLSLMFADNDDLTNSEFESLQNNQLFKQDNKKSSAAINYESDYYNRSKFDTRVGVDSSLDLFALLKHTFDIYKDDNLIFKNYNYLFWRETEHFGINPRVELNYVIDQKNLFRWKYSILLSEKSEGNEWRNTLSLVHQFSSESWLSYDFDIIGASDHDYDVDTYRFGVRYRRQLDVKWLYFEIEQELLWHREPEYTERKLIPGLIFRLEIQFEH